MISFDDLVDTGINTDEIENDLRNIRLNTQINRFSIIDCTNSIESLSSMISTITVADYSASLSSLSSDTLALYNSLTTITGGEGFGYLEPFSAHSTESFIYNCNDVLSNQAFPSFETFKEVGPNINFDNVSFTTNQKLNLKGQTFNSCLIQSNTEHMILNYKLIQNGEYSTNSFINVSADEFKNNILSSNTFINVSGIYNTGNNIFKAALCNIMDYQINDNTFSNIDVVNILGRNINTNTFAGGLYYNILCRNYNSNVGSIAGITNISAVYIQSNTITSGGLFNNTCFSHGKNTVCSIGKINANNLTFTSNILTSNSFVNINGYDIETNDLNSNSLVNIDGYYLNSNSVWGQFLLNTVNGYQMYKNQISGRVGKICQNQGSGNSFQPSILDYTGFSVSSNTIGAYQHGHVRMGFANGDYIGSVDNGGLLTLEVFSAEKINVSSVRGFCDIKAGNLYTCTIYYDTVCNISVKNISGCEINNNPICNIDVWSSYKFNTLSSCNSVKINALNAVIGYNDFKNLSTLKYYIYTDARDVFSTIKELHLRDANIFDSTRNNTFINISSYYFKYTDGLYSGTDIVNNLTSISNSAFIKYVPCSWLNVGGGGGFNYWQSYDEHPLLGYNVSERLESDIMNNDISGVGPAADFYDCTFQDKFVNLTGNEFNSNHIFNNKWYHNLDYLTFNNNSYEIISSLKINCDICSVNTFNQVKYLDLSCIRPISSNSFVSCTDIYINNQGNHQIILSSCKNVNLIGGNFNGVALNNDYVKINCNNIESFNYSNNFNEISCYGCNSNTFKDCDLFSLTAYSMLNNTFNGRGDYKIKCHDCDGLTAEVRQFSIEGYNINNCLLSSYNEGDVSSLWSHDVYLKAFYAESIRAFRISNLHLDISAYLLHANISNIGTLYLNYTLPFISEQKASSDTYLMNNVYIYSCSHFDFPAIGRVVNNGVYSWSHIPSQYVYINGVQLSKLI